MCELISIFFSIYILKSIQVEESLDFLRPIERCFY